MKFRWAGLAASVSLLAAAAAAEAATVSYEDGRNGGKLNVDQVVEGPATVKSDDGKDSLVLRKGAKLRYLGTDTDPKGGGKAERFFLVAGGVQANVGFSTQVATPSFWAYPERAGARATYYAETFGVGTAYARNAKGSGMLRLVAGSNPGTDNLTEIHLRADQGMTVERSGKAGEVGFTTDANNEWQQGVARVFYPLNTGLVVDIYVPKATSGVVRQKEGVQGKTEVENKVSSWKSGKIRVVTLLGDRQTGDGQLAPGVVATIDNTSGKIEIGFVSVEFATLKAAVSLTSEFESLATSPLTRGKHQ